jgi:hypothetical protein
MGIARWAKTAEQHLLSPPPLPPPANRKWADFLENRRF